MFAPLHMRWSSMGNRDLPIEEHAESQARHSRWQRLGWTFFLLVLLAAALGFIGPGPMGKASSSISRLSIHYDRFVRMQSPMQISFRIALSSAHSDSTPQRLWISEDYMRMVDIRRITPQPSYETSDGARLHFYFRPDRSADTMLVMFYTEIVQFGLLRGLAGIVDNDTLHFTQVAYP